MLVNKCKNLFINNLEKNGKLISKCILANENREFVQMHRIMSMTAAVRSVNILN